jgi:hypothetical protein
MNAMAAALLGVVLLGTAAPRVDYAALWEAATPFDKFLASVRAQEVKWKSRFANAAVDADALTRVRALPEKRRILAVAEDRCSDSAWAVPFIAKLAAAVPERLELRIIGRQEGSGVQAENLNPDGRMVTPTVVILDERNRPVGAWVERPAELQAWVSKNKAALSSDQLHDGIDKWYTEDAGRSTLREIVVLLERAAPAGGK